MTPVTLPMRGGLVVLLVLTALLAGYAAYGLRQHRMYVTRDQALGRLRADLVMMIGMTAVGWCITCLALLWNPTLGQEHLVPGSVTQNLFAISRGCLMLVFWQVVGFAAFLLRQVQAVTGGSPAPDGESPGGNGAVVLEAQP